MPSGDDDETAARCAPLLFFGDVLSGFFLAACAFLECFTSTHQQSCAAAR